MKIIYYHIVFKKAFKTYLKLFLKIFSRKNFYLFSYFVLLHKSLVSHRTFKTNIQQKINSKV